MRACVLAAVCALRTYTRHLMGRMEADLGTGLDWVAVNHWNTDNPHTHIVVRGRDDTGKDLIIAGDYIADGWGCAPNWRSSRPCSARWNKNGG